MTIAAAASLGLASAALAGDLSERWEDALRGRIAEYVRLRLDQPGARVTVPALGDFRFPEGIRGPVAMRLSTHETARFRSHVPVTVVLEAGGREIKRGVVTARVERRRALPVAARELPAGARIGEDDVRMEAVDERSLASDAVRSRSQLIGRETTRPVSAGSPWSERGVRDAPLVKRGERVRLRLVQGALQIESLGRARGDAAAGERVSVSTERSRREITGTVGRDGVVHVDF